MILLNAISADSLRGGRSLWEKYDVVVDNLQASLDYTA